ncbi:MAG: PIN domain-containing protein [Chloroflexota bacterium]|nr:PIN domain-containing protein [Chloroflexota bacterium]
MSVFVDTSALFAILDADDSNHARADEAWSRLLTEAEELVSTNYVLVETFALVQRRLGVEAVKTLHEDIVPVLTIEWIDRSQHTSAISQLIATAHRQISLVDWISFGTMQRLRIKTAFAFDQDFQARGFQTVPSETR